MKENYINSQKEDLYKEITSNQEKAKNYQRKFLIANAKNEIKKARILKIRQLECLKRVKETEEKLYELLSKQKGN